MREQLVVIVVIEDALASDRILADVVRFEGLRTLVIFTSSLLDQLIVIVTLDLFDVLSLLLVCKGELGDLLADLHSGSTAGARPERATFDF